MHKYTIWLLMSTHCKAKHLDSLNKVVRLGLCSAPEVKYS